MTKVWVQNGEPMVSRSALSRRGWTAQLMETLLGEADCIESVHSSTDIPPTRLYSLRRVEAAERSGAFLEAQKLQAAKTEENADKLRNEFDNLVAEIKRLEIIVDVIDIEEARQQAIVAYNSRRHERLPDQIDPGFLGRITVNWLRHERTFYDHAIELIAGHYFAAQATRLIRHRVLDAIAAAYPELHRECERQKRVRELINVVGAME